NTPERAAVPAIDFHAHLGRWLNPAGGWFEPDVGRLLAVMDSTNVASMVNLDGRWGQELEDNLDRYDRAHPGRFFTFCHVDWSLLDQPNGPDLLVKSLQRSVAAGARGLKIWKDLGLWVRARGHQVLPDDPLVAPLWEAAGALGVPVLAHVADPAAFFLPVDRRNERLEELLRFPSGSRQRGGLPEFHRLLSSLENVVGSNPRTQVVAAHGFHGEDLGHVGAVMREHPNFHIDIGWAHLQLGRQPRAASALISDYPDRVLLGSDVYPVRAAALRTYFRLLETADENFTYTDEPVPGSGRWAIYGLALGPEELRQVYQANASRLLARPT
ncbi:MAG TPA: amidohydrolase family protein, partial [Acidimicrobiales bacterium]|nr:amidohydrolase family protein [Acidimicrobiales bacterium]